MLPLLDLPHGEARRLLATGAPVYLSINPVEYHGPHLSLHNDRLISAGLLTDVHARLRERHPEWPLLFACDLELGVDPCWGPGSRHTSYAAATALIREACRALAELGAQRVVLMTFHGSPLHSLALEAGVQLLRRRGVRAVAPFHIVLAALARHGRVDRARFAAGLAHVQDGAERAAMITDLQLDFHAGFFETSVALHYAPDSVSPMHRTLPPCPPFPRRRKSQLIAGAARLVRRLRLGDDAGELADDLDFVATALGWYELRPFPGYTGRPHQARAESGALFARFMVDEMAPLVESVLCKSASAPPPILPWLAALTLGGRIGGIRLAPGQMPGIDAR
jgi:creatinine amidohydrolase